MYLPEVQRVEGENPLQYDYEMWYVKKHISIKQELNEKSCWFLRYYFEDESYTSLHYTDRNECIKAAITHTFHLAEETGSLDEYIKMMENGYKQSHFISDYTIKNAGLHKRWKLRKELEKEQDEYLNKKKQMPIEIVPILYSWKKRV